VDDRSIAIPSASQIKLSMWVIITFVYNFEKGVDGISLRRTLEEW